MIKDSAIRAQFDFQVLRNDFLVLVGINQLVVHDDYRIFWFLTTQR